MVNIYGYYMVIIYGYYMVNIYGYYMVIIYGYYIVIIWLMKNDGVRQMGSWHSQYDGKNHPVMFQTTSHGSCCLISRCSWLTIH